MNDVQTATPELDHVILVLTGPHAGRDITLGNYRFIQGRTVVFYPASQCSGIIKYMSRCYQAFPEGSPELAAALGRSVDGQSEPEAAQVPGSAGEIPGDVQSTGGGPPSGATEDGGRDDAGRSGDPGIHSVGEERPSAETAERREASVPTPQAQSESKVREALSMLDHGNDELWTRDGRPTVAAVATFAGQSVKRSTIEAVDPNFRRNQPVPVQ